MRDLTSKIRITILPFLSLCIVSCGATLPLQEISTAKQEITRAKIFNSERYAKSELDDSKSNLLKAHENAFSSKPDVKKVEQLSQLATDKARQATNKSLPNYVKDLQKDAETALDSANIAFAESLASDIYEQAKLLKIEADSIIKNADAKLANQPKDIKQEETSIYSEYEMGVKRYNESIAASEKAKDLSLSQTQTIIDSSSDIESDLDLIDKYAKEDKEIKSKTALLREDHKSAITLMEAGNLRDGLKNVEKIRTSSNELMTIVILPYAKERIKTATIKIEEAEKFLNQDTDSAKSSVSADNLGASKEAFTSSVDLLAKERYYDSIQQSDEALRLADEILNSDIKVENDSSKKERSTKEVETNTDISSDEKQTEEPSPEVKSTKKQSKATSTISENNNSKNNLKFKKHIVRKKNPPETLWRIAKDKEYLGDKNLWKEIYKANKKSISDPNLIYPNQIILIPTKTEKTKK